MWAQTWWLLAAVVAALAAVKVLADGDHHPVATIRRWTGAGR